jgi:hypothetical protein
METRPCGGFFMSDRKLDEVTLAVFGDHDAGYGVTYAQSQAEDIYDDGYDAECDLDWSDFNFGKKPKIKR